MFHLKYVDPRYAALAALGNRAIPGIFAALLPLALALPLPAPATAQDTADPVVIAALGDSLTAGYGLAPDEGLVPRLQDWLAARDEGDVTLLNAGVSGDTTAGGLARLDWTLTPEVEGLIVTLGGNDMLRGLPPAEARANLEAILAGAEARGIPVLLVGLPGPSNYGPDYKAEFDAIYPNLAAEHDALLYPDIFAPLTEATAGDPAALSAFMQADGIHPNPEGVGRIVEGMGPSVLALVARIRD